MNGQGNGGPAFPRAGGPGESCEGMSLRDWFAGQAASSLSGACLALPGISAEDTAKAAYELADAMLEARKR